MTLYKRIKERREQLGLTQDELAKKMGYKSRSSINKIEIGENDIPQSKIEQFAKALETTTAYLMGWEDTAEAPNVNAQETELLTIFRQLSPHSKFVVLQAAREELRFKKFVEMDSPNYLGATAHGGENIMVPLDDRQSELLRKMLDDYEKNSIY